MIVTVLLVAGALAALLLSGFFSGVETGTYCVDRIRVQIAARDGAAGARRLLRLIDRPEDLVIVTLLGTNIADYLFSVCVTALLLNAAVATSHAEAYTTAVATPLVLVFGTMVPKNWFRRDANALMTALSAPIAAAAWAARAIGALWLLRSWAHALIRRIDPSSAALETTVLPRVRTLRLLREGAVRGGLTPSQREMIERVLNISKVPLIKIMVPRQRAAIVPHDISRDSLLRIARMAHFSRLPVYRGDPRRIIGIINVYDILTDDRPSPISAHIQPALMLKSDETVPAAMLKLQRAHQTMAIVTDSDGSALGLLTMKDLVEEIVGELEAW